ncbi:MAG TPA: response regulator [Bryobacteraceae bacterium]|nr:response regulator [Bryobacteraceae bacterium]
MGYAPRILVVDDEPAVRLLLEQVLSDVGYYVTLAANGRLALAQVRSREFDVVIIDLSLPDRDGIEVLRQIRSEFSHMPILALSGYMVGDMPQIAMAAGATDTLQKPASPEALLLTVYGLIEPRSTWAGK